MVLDELVVRSRRLDAQTAAPSPLEPFPRLRRVPEEVVAKSVLGHLDCVLSVSNLALRALERALHYLVLERAMPPHRPLGALSPARVLRCCCLEDLLWISAPILAAALLRNLLPRRLLVPVAALPLLDPSAWGRRWKGKATLAAGALAAWESFTP